MSDLFVIEARWPGELYDVREFIQPRNAAVSILCEELLMGLSAPAEKATVCRNWVIDNVTYPLTAEGEPTDYHELRAYLRSKHGGGTYVRAIAANDFWEMPAEVVGFRMADCDGRSTLLASMLRTFLPPEDVMASVGELEGHGGHAWNEVRLDGVWHIVDSSMRSIPTIPLERTVDMSYLYTGEFRFNDQTYEGEWAHFIPHRNDPRKLIFLERVWGCLDCGVVA